jgi:V/A-type H+-transporting ATPase subunit I
MLVRTYGLPGYNDVDPTPLLGISFLTMFGMMFGDVGHGAMLAAIGAAMAFLPYKALDAMRDLGKILMGAGGSGMVFGLLFGSIFGVEKDSVLPAIWMRPGHPENLARFLGAALALGVVIISTGIILGIVQAVRRRDLRSALIGPWSACSLVFYWGLLLVLGLQLAGRPAPLPVGAMAALLAVPVVLIGAGQFLLQMVDQRRGRHGPHADAELATIAFEPIEVVMNLFTNSVSFLRVAAFGLAHAALTTAVFVVNDMVRLPGSSIISLPFEHIFVVVMEGMIVTIQCLRLEYYEFFSKFFRGEGVAYAPLTAAED